jgi:hypothetical protein
MPLRWSPRLEREPMSTAGFEPLLTINLPLRDFGSPCLPANLRSPAFSKCGMSPPESDLVRHDHAIPGLRQLRDRLLAVGAEEILAVQQVFLLAVAAIRQSAVCRPGKQGRAFRPRADRACHSLGSWITTSGALLQIQKLDRAKLFPKSLRARLFWPPIGPSSQPRVAPAVPAIDLISSSPS